MLPEPGQEDIVWHNDALRRMCQPLHFGASEVRSLLAAHGMFRGHEFPTGLRAASSTAATSADGAYRYAWLRDNMHLALADLSCGRSEAAVRVVQAWLGVFHADRLINGPEAEPPIKVHGETGLRVEGPWSHDQHDALGMFVFVSAQLVAQGLVEAPPIEEAVRHVARHLERVEYWHAQDSGHWEEERRVNASSIGCVVAGSSAWAHVARRCEADPVFPKGFIERGADALHTILPWETPASDVRGRRYDAALLFLLEPLACVEGPVADQIVSDVVGQLGRLHGIVRYLGDSYWAPDYRYAVDEAARAVDYSDRIDERNRLARVGAEAQWTLFDPVLSTWFGKRWLRSNDRRDLDRQRHHLLRTLAAVTSDHTDCPGRLPEAYFLEDGVWVLNDHVPLLWAEANLEVALRQWGLSSETGS